VTESGTHEHLMSIEGDYARLLKIQDLGQGKGSPGKDDDETGALVGTTTTRATDIPFNDTDVAKPGTMGYSLLKCLWILVREQPELWWCFGITLAACAAAGLTFPAVAFVFSRAIGVFQLTGAAITDRGDFFALMFFVIALGNLISYFTMGWFANIFCQVNFPPFQFSFFATSHPNQEPCMVEYR
jgi:ATP-binding cassette, subfamily B (MDR/TAP), member 1